MNREELIGVYAIHLPGERVYIGVTCDSFKGRWRGHKSKLHNNSHPNKALQNIYNKYGKESLKFEILECYSKATSKNDGEVMLHFLLLRELELWQQYKSNNSFRVINGMPKRVGKYKNSHETNEKISQRYWNYNKKIIYFDYCKYSDCETYYSRWRAHDSKFCSVECLELAKADAVKKRMAKLPDNPKIIEELYWVECLSPEEIAKIYNCSQQSIRNYMKRKNIKIRTVKFFLLNPIMIVNTIIRTNKV